MAKIIWHNERRAIRELIPYEVNPRQITDKQAKDLKASLAKFGIADPIIINTDNMIIGGHQRMKILETLLGYEPDFQIDVRVPDRELSIDEVRELNVRLNKNVAEWDFDTLANNFELDDLLDWGFDKKELDLDLWAGDAPEDVEPQIDKAEELREKWGVKLGDLWQLGEHRLICGDCTDKVIVKRVMQSDISDIVVTDPPYGVDYIGKTKDALTIENDGRDTLFGLLFAWLVVAKQFMRDGSAFYIAAPPGPQSYEFSNAIVKSGLNWRQTLVWVKNSMVLGHSDYHYKHEIVYYGSNGKKAKFYGNRKNVSVTSINPDQPFREIEDVREIEDGVFQLQVGQDVYLVRGNNIEIDKVWPDVVNIKRPSVSKLHPTMKPVELMELFISNSSAKGDICYDPFLGSGTTLIACERLGRKCRAVEISPAYCAVAIQRWVDVTNGTPELVN